MCVACSPHSLISSQITQYRCFIRCASNHWFCQAPWIHLLACRCAQEPPAIAVYFLKNAASSFGSAGKFLSNLISKNFIKLGDNRANSSSLPSKRLWNSALYWPHHFHWTSTWHFSIQPSYNGKVCHHCQHSLSHFLYFLHAIFWLSDFYFNTLGVIWVQAGTKKRCLYFLVGMYPWQKHNPRALRALACVGTVSILLNSQYFIQHRTKWQWPRWLSRSVLPRALDANLTGNLPLLLEEVACKFVGHLSIVYNRATSLV